jgi:hypothetical protein
MVLQKLRQAMADDAQAHLEPGETIEEAVVGMQIKGAADFAVSDAAEVSVPTGKHFGVVGTEQNLYVFALAANNRVAALALKHPIGSVPVERRWRFPWLYGPQLWIGDFRMTIGGAGGSRKAAKQLVTRVGDRASA